MTVYYSGRVTTVVYENDAQSFYILKMELDENKKRVTVRGNVPGLSVKTGTWFGFEGKWETHQTYGRQIVVSKAPVVQGTWDTETALKLLVGHGVGESLCQGLYDQFGDDLIDKLTDKEALQEAPAVTEFTALHIVSRWQAIRAMFQALDFLSALNLPKQRVDQIWAEFGGEAEAVLSEDPWSLVRIDGITFDQADEVARKLGLDMGSSKRLKGAALYACKLKRGMGHVYLTTGELISGIRAYVPEVTNADVAKTLKELHDAELLIIDNKTKPNITAIYEPWFYEVEKESAFLLADRVRTAGLDGEEEYQSYLGKLGTVGPNTLAVVERAGASLEDVASSAIEEWSSQSKMALSDHQLEGAVNAMMHPVSILTGLPGTGKTTTLRVVVKVLQDAGIPFLLVAPTGIAAKRLSSVTGAEASTIHRAFGAKGINGSEDRESTYAGIIGMSSGEIGGDGSNEFWGFSAVQPHPAKVVICDESSMVDQHLLFRLLTCTSKRCRLVFVGDAAQLPSVGPGNVLRDMISADLFPVVDLKEIFRQEEASDIVLAAHAIHSGVVPTFPEKSKDFTFAEIQDETRIQDTLTVTVKKLYDKRVNFQVLSPRHSGQLGVTNLNVRIRDLLNPKTPGLREMRLGPETIREGDRIMVSKNNYKYEIFNGDVGKVVRLDEKAKQIEIKIWGPPTIHVRMSFKEAPAHLRMAYCVTVHKCLHPDTMVETVKGLCPISLLPDSGVLGTPGGPKTYLRKVVNPSAPMLRVTTKDGYQVSVTPEHGLDVWDSDKGSYVRKEARTLGVGDFLRLRMNPELDAVEPAVLPQSQVDVRAKTYRVPLVLTEEMAEFLGLFVADGTLYRKGFRLAKRHLEVADRFAELCVSLFGVDVSRFIKLGAHHVEVNSVFLSHWLSQIGGLHPHAKDVPSCVLQSPLELQQRFLRGLFEDGSVHLRTGDSTKLDHIELASKFSALRDKVRLLLLRMGIICGKVDGEVPSLQIYGASAKKFGETVGFITAFKQRRALLPVGPERYVLPVSRELVKTLRRELGSVVPQSVYQNGVNRQRISRHAAREILKHSTRSLAQLELASLLEDHHSQVALIELFESPSVCVEVPDGHRFLQNGFYGWNSQGQEYDVILMPWSKSFGRQLQRNLIYTAITRARKKVILVGHKAALETAVNNNKVDTRNTLFPERLLDLLDG